MFLLHSKIPCTQPSSFVLTHNLVDPVQVLGRWCDLLFIEGLSTTSEELSQSLHSFQERNQHQYGGSAKFGQAIISSLKRLICKISNAVRPDPCDMRSGQRKMGFSADVHSHSNMRLDAKKQYVEAFSVM